MKFNSKPIPEHEEVPLADDGQWEALVEEWSQKHLGLQNPQGSEGNLCFVLSVGQERDSMIRKAQLVEIVSLVEAQGGTVVGQEIVVLRSINPRTLIGKGKSRELAARARQCGATMIVVDAELSPSQLRNLEDMAGIPICDREAVILNVFLKHASTKASRIQVEIAQLEYLRPRIRGIGINMDQQTGGIGGNAGAGETASELLARKIGWSHFRTQKDEQKAPAGWKGNSVHSGGHANELHFWGTPMQGKHL